LSESVSLLDTPRLFQVEVARLRILRIGVAAVRYDEAWRPEAQAVAWVSQRFLFGNPANTLRSVVSGIFGLNLAELAKSSATPYSEVRKQAERFGPLWK
jgi:kynurenine 3-monooxygenase